jgi:NAD(P)-dependent dehydrogenase (short-subunit alcohol dehydrogenase family)
MGRVGIVTGAASGIGQALATALVKRGDTVVLADVNADGAKQVAAGLGSRASAVGLDVRDADAVTQLVDDVVGDHGRLDLMFNNAGIGVGGREVDELTAAHWRRIVDVNLLGVVSGTVAAYQVMVARGGGHIVNTASVAGLMPAPLLTPYAMTKHAVVGLSLSLRAEAAARGVRVSVVCPGVIETPLLDSEGPADLPTPAHRYDSRTLLVHAAGKPYPAAALAADVLRGVDRNRAVIAAPARARIGWWLQRLAPTLLEKQNIRATAWTRAHARKP